MANITYQITTDIANPLIEGFVWSGVITGIDLGTSPLSSYPTSVSGVYGGLNISFNPHATNGFKIYASTQNTNHYTTFRSQNVETQYPNTGYSLDIWSAALYNDINNGKSWQALTEDGPYPLNTTKYSLLYNYGGPNATMFIKGGKIAFDIQV